jgi:DNA-binding NarL/FixJ family response regulator
MPAASPSSPHPIRVAVLEDDEVTRQRFCAAVRGALDMRLVADFGIGGQALAWLEQNEIDVLLADLGLPDVPGLAVIAYCARRHPQADIMVISIHEDEQHVVRSLEAGASGYLLKDSGDDEITGRIRELRKGGAPMSPVIARLVLKRFRSAPPGTPSRPVDEVSSWVLPTPRELLVLTRIAQGFSYAEIAELEGISRHTVHAHVKNIYSKLSVHSRSEAVFEANRLGLITPPGIG